jgi:ornithine cyclodeaminase/alanine dehydrogenase-like protein (mu-crystallin family)
MPLVLTDAEVKQLLPLSLCIETMEMTFGQFNEGRAANRPRMRYTCPSTLDGMSYAANVHIGAVPGAGVAVVRVGSYLRASETNPERREMSHGNNRRSTSLVYLYSLETTELVCILPEHALDARVAATTAVAARYLAGPGARVLGLFGTGNHARYMLPALLKTVESLAEVRVYSPNPAHRQAFVEEMGAQLDRPIRGVAEPRAVVDGADVVACATNSSRPVFPGEWLQRGQLVTTIVSSDVIDLRTEVDETTFVRSDFIVLNDRESVTANVQREVLEPLEQGKIGWGKIHELGELVTGKFVGRERPDQLIYYKNNSGLGIQFAALGGIAYQRAREAKIGRDIPTDWLP